jgi:hypothetical protein
MLTTLFQASVSFKDYAADAELPGADSSIGEVIANILGGVMAIAVLMVLIYLVWGAIGWITSGGDAAKITKARDKMTQAVIGLIVLAASVAIFALVQSFLGIEVLNFEDKSGKTQVIKNTSIGKEAESFSPSGSKVEGGKTLNN